ncbi:hypothetical protein D3C78_1917510 [compost metagenome]
MRDADITKGTKETTRKRILELSERYGVDEFIIASVVNDFEKRVRSFTLLKEAFTELAV